MDRSISQLAGRGNRRRPVLIAFALAATLLVPAAIAWACNPQAYLRLDQTGYAAGEQMQVSGAFFKGNRELTLSFEPGGQLGKVTTAGNGFFAAPFKAPTTPGSYTLTAVGYEEDGSITNGLPAMVSVEVSAAAAQPQQGQPGAQAQPNQPGAQAQPNRPSAPQPGGGQLRFAEPEEPSARPFSPRDGSPRGGAQPQTQAGGGTRSGDTGTGSVIKTPTGDVFAGSAAPDDGATAGASSSQSASGESASGQSAGAAAREGRAGNTNGGETPSEGSVSGDVWSGFGSSAAPSITGATDAAPEGGTGSQLAWGLGLLGLGLAALAGGLTAPAVRRRRAGAR